MGLKHHVLFESQEPGAEFRYDKNLVQGTFLHTLCRGLNEKTMFNKILNLFSTTRRLEILDQITKSTRGDRKAKTTWHRN